MDQISYRGRGDKPTEMNNDEGLNFSVNNRFRFKPEKKNIKKSIFLKFNWKLILITLVAWVFIINHYERRVVSQAMNRCAWSNWENWDNVNNEPHRIALLADPQIMDEYSYPGRPWLINWITQKILDNYHKRNWNFIQNKLDPDSTIFLGDLFDGGRNWDDEDWIQEYKRFNSIYYKKPNRKTIMTLPGNHDIGFGDTVNITSLERFKTFFGDTSSIHQLGNHTIVLLDTISLSDSIAPEVRKHPQQVLDSLSEYDPNENPRILLSHVPLYRFPEQQPCGPLRESNKPFPVMKGNQYQTVIDYEISQDILTKIRPKIAFSGDDHDYCHVSHEYNHPVGGKAKADEITVKSCSMNMGISKPAFQLLSLNNPKGTTSSETYKTNICFLPLPFRSLKAYITMGILNLILYLIIFLLPQKWALVTNKFKALVADSEAKFQLPIATEITPSYQPVLVLEKDILGFFINGVIIIIGVLSLFSVYYNAF
ncbi:Metallophosphoesterase 1 [Wickerhamomyces ciferrii]|uniref:Metallophosphoesterase 1 n=1 Tax=Wickerhamomyces ciferrii (strain ATCC 14091 / BCRC 22168 / CBS 111 / JCM 3599 / NBRC 0793 / NRRL Y-1031 F-60-10) TaxID=1206466 RepID=K0KM21_WICCF|nr:Metallophosphoesterase 1 [Wickerhamomyces ciferrii]CCH43252.1 Metallophosphoesterase 1 [Wickerhamomyces ciferrii]